MFFLSSAPLRMQIINWSRQRKSEMFMIYELLITMMHKIYINTEREGKFLKGESFCSRKLRRNFSCSIRVHFPSLKLLAFPPLYKWDAHSDEKDCSTKVIWWTNLFNRISLTLCTSIQRQKTTTSNEVSRSLLNIGKRKFLQKIFTKVCVLCQVWVHTSVKLCNYFEIYF